MAATATTLSPRAIAKAAWQAGFKGPEIAIATAVALAESHGNPAAHALTSREDSRGLWQINVRAHPQYSNSDLYNPQVNADAAYDVYAQDGWQPWTTYTNGTYRGNLSAATTASKNFENTSAPKVPKEKCDSVCLAIVCAGLGAGTGAPCGYAGQPQLTPNLDVQKAVDKCVEQCKAGATRGQLEGGFISQGRSSGLITHDAPGTGCQTFQTPLIHICFDKPIAALGIAFAAVAMMVGTYILFRASAAEAQAAQLARILGPLGRIPVAVGGAASDARLRVGQYRSARQVARNDGNGNGSGPKTAGGVKLRPGDKLIDF